MRPNSPLVLVLLVAFSMIAAPLRLAPISPARGSGCSLELRTSKKCYASGEAIPLEYLLENRSGRRVVVYVTEFFITNKIILLDERGHEVEPTAQGKAFFAQFDPGCRKGWDRVVKVDLTKDHPVRSGLDDLRRFFKIRRGRYRVQACFEQRINAVPILVESDWLTFRIQ